LIYRIIGLKLLKLHFFIFFILTLSIPSIVNGQCIGDIPDPGSYCDPTIAGGAPILCMLDCLDGYEGMLPDTMYGEQPENLCQGGTPNNIVWYAFVAGSENIDILIEPINCSEASDMSGNSSIGIQAGIYTDCTFDFSVVCATDGCLDSEVEDLALSSNEFEIGEMYFLFIDGCGGSVCDYRIQVNDGGEAFDLPSTSPISNDLNFNLPEDTICLGAEITFNLDSLNYDLDFLWMISPATDSFPDGLISAVDTNVYMHTFEEEGDYTISIIAYNSCDTTDTMSFDVVVEALEDEYFTDIDVCQGCFPFQILNADSGCILPPNGSTVSTIFTEDPNGDGVTGWLGTDLILAPGIDTNLVTNNFKCSYSQYVNVNEIPLSPREFIEEYFCLQDFPLDYNGVTFNFPGQSRNVTLDGAAASGCDSLINLTAQAIDILGNLSIGNCMGSGVELGFDITILEPSTPDSISYVWFDQNGNVVTDNDQVDSTLMVSTTGSYSVEVTVSYNGLECSLTFGSVMVDTDDLGPQNPQISYAPVSLCVQEEIAQIYVMDQGVGEFYEWILTPALPFVEGETSDTIYVDVTSGESFEFCVQAINNCDSSMIICDEVEVYEVPIASFEIDTVACINDSLEITYDGIGGNLPSSIFNWNFDSGIIVNGANPDSKGPFVIQYSSPGEYTITLNLEDDGCVSEMYSQTVQVNDILTAPNVTCQSEIGSITFSWQNGTSDFHYNVITGQDNIVTTDTSITVASLSSFEDVEVELTFMQEGFCNEISILETCTSLECPLINFDISDLTACIDQESLELSTVISGDDSGNLSWESEYIENDSTFNVNSSGSGTFPVGLVYELASCSYSVDTQVTILELPNVNYSTGIYDCETLNQFIEIEANENTILLDANEVTPQNEISIDEGQHVLRVIDKFGCENEEVFEISSITFPFLEILGNTEVAAGSENSFTSSINWSENNYQIFWLVNGDTLCTQCDEITTTINEEAEICVGIKYFDFCESIECLNVSAQEEVEIYTSNVFSPNGDNNNDEFVFMSNKSDAIIESIEILDRWGERIYMQTDFVFNEQAKYWDGYFNNKLVSQGVYVYVITYRTLDGTIKKKIGDVTVIY